tara:strand:+ start:23787 stop:24101 length:315 start_codon:yes stop_codon:yes gene_type:complete
MSMQTFDETLPEIISSEGVVLVDFFADWCQPCKMLMPTIEEIASNYEGRVTVGKVNTEDHATIATDYGVNALPTLILFKDGKEVERLIGLKSADEISAAIDAQL